MRRPRDPMRRRRSGTRPESCPRATIVGTSVLGRGNVICIVSKINDGCAQSEGRATMVLHAALRCDVPDCRFGSADPLVGGLSPTLGPAPRHPPLDPLPGPGHWPGKAAGQRGGCHSSLRRRSPTCQSPTFAKEGRSVFKALRHWRAVYPTGWFGLLPGFCERLMRQREKNREQDSR
jgi:hypothetical protein